MLVFVCDPKQGIRLRAEACGARHEHAGAEGRPGVIKLDDLVCRTCPVGRAHRAGETPARWPDGSPILRIDLQPRGTLNLEDV